eukprot:Hpha_TRINITY_DN22762_c0_g1::TRINITY_DN22762_c0_g1_i1::g.34271::m.34271
MALREREPDCDFALLKAERSAVVARWKRASETKGATLPHGMQGYLDLFPRLPLAEVDEMVARDFDRSYSAVPPGLRKLSGVEDSHIEELLKRVLIAWVCRSFVEGLGTGYVQGMGYVASLCVAVLGTEGEREVFAMLCLMLEDVLSPSLYAEWPPLAGCEVAAVLAADDAGHMFPPTLLPDESVQLMCGMLCPSWLLGGFVDDLPSVPLLRLWTAAIDLADTSRKPSPRRGALPLMMMLRWAVAVIANSAPDACAEATSQCVQPAVFQIFQAIKTRVRRLPDGFQAHPAALEVTSLKQLLSKYDAVLRARIGREAAEDEAKAAAVKVREEDRMALQEHLRDAADSLGAYPVYEDWVDSLPAWSLGACAPGMEYVRCEVWGEWREDLSDSLRTPPRFGKILKAASKLGRALRSVRSPSREGDVTPVSPALPSSDKEGDVDEILRRLNALFAEASHSSPVRSKRGIDRFTGLFKSRGRKTKQTGGAEEPKTPQPKAGLDLLVVPHGDGRALRLLCDSRGGGGAVSPGGTPLSPLPPVIPLTDILQI